jgi:peptide/nickel transport system permease protein
VSQDISGATTGNSRWGVPSRRWEVLHRLGENPRIVIGLFIILACIFCAVFAPQISPYDPIKINLRIKYQPPSVQHFLGTDIVGRDVLSRLIWGSRVSLLTSFLSIGFAVVMGTFLGVTAGFFGGKTDTVISRFIDMLLALPAFIMAIILMGVLGRGLVNMIFAIGVGMAPRIARVVRGAAMSVKVNDFVEAARSFGFSSWRIILRHILPHCLTPIVVYATLLLGSAVMLEAGLSFLGLGVAPPTPSWGLIVTEGADVMRDLPWMVTTGGLLIVVLVLAFNLLGDGLRDQLDPRMQKRSFEVGGRL